MASFSTGTYGPTCVLWCPFQVNVAPCSRPHGSAFLSRQRVALTQPLSENISSFASPLLLLLLQQWPLLPRLTAPLTPAWMNVVLPLPHYSICHHRHASSFSPRCCSVPCPVPSCSLAGIFLRLLLLHHPAPVHGSLLFQNWDLRGFVSLPSVLPGEINAPKLSIHFKHPPSLVSKTRYSQPPCLPLTFRLPFTVDPGTAKPGPALRLIPGTRPGRDEVISLSGLP